ncbi:Isoamyl acetate-hydrolyzing esterase 1-like protein [Smittium culicis]|uniref:Isoamyl acetate-hydrolyzing esterase 1-like protein n=1 Tax=Smittium culicis TaxID=133412 RepID=A0A1R1XUF5_9FUNG|nr:Isoamyl acetate-hydrolyzing esterase 1-like protein [Smittium culicis]OMJ18297.1 Isoamyl acetate-hydrolyzing esterase 1-like protein [Smittium culicis]
MYTFDGYINDVIIAFGDSITQFGQIPELNGWVSQLGNLYIRRLDVLNRGFSGYNTISGGVIFPRLFPTTSEKATPAKVSFPETEVYNSVEELAVRADQEFGFEKKLESKIKLVIIFLGANDSCFSGTQQHVPLIEFKRNIESMITLLRDPSSEKYSPGTNIVLITPPPISEVMWEKTLAGVGVYEVSRSNLSVKEYANAVVEVGKKHGIPAIDAWTALMDEIKAMREERFKSAKLDDLRAQSYSDASHGFEELLIDGLHLTKRGNDKVFKMLTDIIDEQIPELRCDNIGELMPDWKALFPVTK